MAAKDQAQDLTVSRADLLVDGSDQPFRQFVHDTLAFAARIQEVRSRLGQAIGLSGTQYTVLIAIAHLQARDGDPGVNLVAEHLHLSGAFVTTEINKLVAGGLVEKTGDPADRRRIRLAITPKARDLLDRLTEVQRPANDALFACMSADDFAILRRMMSQLIGTADDALRLLDYMSPAAGAVRSGRQG